ncbi:MULTISPECIES: acyl-CoA dehydrogenase family protein [Rhodomicrobium]|uniref:acyl-CoA dehydrogenase family protein n=1 Tax=Rhodomicrobium TaxID=1068 RepID=UPI001FD9214D|nr:MULTISPECIES: acyl-CoA dehydrogenase family protein [Rhodomicrobium]
MSETNATAPRRPWANMGAGYNAMMQRAEALVPMLRERAVETEALRRLPEETERALHASGLFRICQPRRVGGAELDYVAMIDIADVLARGDASVAWNVTNLASHHWMLAMFDEAAQNAIWDESPDVLIASSFVFPAGRAKKAEGGYVLKGRWPFCSGVEPSGWSMLAGMVAGEGGPPEHRVFLVPRSDYKIIDTWTALGLQGTGSHDVEIAEAFVPEHMTVAVASMAGGPTPGHAVNPAPLFRIPVFALFPYVLSGIALGNAQACLDDYVEATRTRTATFNSARLGDLQSIQIKIAEASAKIDAARLIMRQACIDAQQDAAAGRIPGMLEKNRYRRDGAFSVNLCTEAVSTLFAISGARGLAMSGAVQRQLRDALAVAAHISFSFDAAGGNFGKVALGLPNENPVL